MMQQPDIFLTAISGYLVTHGRIAGIVLCWGA